MTSQTLPTGYDTNYTSVILAAERNQRLPEHTFGNKQRRSQRGGAAPART
jgi:hypothetical protein